MQTVYTSESPLDCSIQPSLVWGWFTVLCGALSYMLCDIFVKMDIYERAGCIVAAVPCPPLPMVGVNFEGEEVVFSSHDLLRTMFLNILMCADVETRQVHLLETQHVEEKMYNDLEQGCVCVYSVFCSYVRGLMQVHKATHPDIRFKEVDYISVGDKIHQKACSHLRGQDHMYNFSSACYDKVPYSDLLNIYASRIIHKSACDM